MLSKWLLVPDCHIPYHDQAAFSLMLRAARAIECQHVVVLGDFLDFYSVSAHDKDPNRSRDLDWEINQGRSALKQIDQVITGRKIYIAGNHEDRLTRYLMTRAPELFNSVKIPDLLKLNDTGWNYVPYKAHTRIGKLYVTHDAGRAGKYAHYDALAAFQSNIVIGHVHRLGWIVEGTAKGKPHVAASLGWLGDFDKVDYMHKIRAMRDWAHGFGIAYIEADGTAHVVPVPIVNGKVCVEGKLIK